MINKQISKWLNQQRKKQFLIINKIDLLKLQKWVFNQKEIYHESKRFFKIVGIKIKSNFYKKKNLVPTDNCSKRNWYFRGYQEY